MTTMLYNPLTNEPRTREEIETDPHGHEFIRTAGALLRNVLIDANDACRSAHSVVKRIATEYETKMLGTDFGALQSYLHESLKRQHATIVAYGGYTPGSSGGLAMNLKSLGPQAAPAPTDNAVDMTHGSVKHGDEFPYDAPDAWWDLTPPPAFKPRDWAHRAARGIIANLRDRRGIKHGFDDIDEETRVEIVATLAEIIRSVAK